MHRVALLALTVCLPSLAAQELLVRDVRLSMGMMPTTFSYTSSDALATASGDDELDDAWAVGLRASWSWSAAGRPWAPIVGAEVLAERAAYGGEGSYEQAALRGVAGLGWQFSDAWRATALAVLGVGRPSFTVPIAGGGTVSTAGASASTGVLVGVDWAFARAWRVGLEAGWQEERATLSGDGVDLDLTRSGAVAMLGLSWAWSRRPVRLD